MARLVKKTKEKSELMVIFHGSLFFINDAVYLNNPRM